VGNEKGRKSVTLRKKSEKLGGRKRVLYENRDQNLGRKTLEY